MAAPNLLSPTTITGKTAYVSLSTTNATSIISNPVSSGKVFKVNSLIVANVDGTNAASITVSLYSQDDIGGTPYKIANTITVPADASLVVIDKTSMVYLEEDKSLGAVASAASDLEIICSYEEIA